MVAKSFLGVVQGRPDNPAAGVVHQDVDPAEGTDRGPQQLLRRAGPGEVADERARIVARDAQLLDRLFRLCLPQRCDDHLGAVGQQPPGDAEPYSGGAPGHDRGTAA